MLPGDEDVKSEVRVEVIATGRMVLVVCEETSYTRMVSAGDWDKS